jgi:hypothetical protein
MGCNRAILSAAERNRVLFLLEFLKNIIKYAGAGLSRTRTLANLEGFFPGTKPALSKQIHLKNKYADLPVVSNYQDDRYRPAGGFCSDISFDPSSVK